MKKKLAVVGLLLFVLALGIGLGTYLALRRPTQASAGFRTGVFEPARDAPDFTLDGSNGAKVSLHGYAGKVVILEFGYTSCQQVCPVTLAHLVQVQEKLGAAAANVQVVYVTVDPKRDNPERLHKYLASFSPAFLGATGTAAELATVRQAYGILADEVISKNAQLGYEMAHSSFIYLIDRQGKIRTLVPFGTPADDIAHDITLLLEK